MKRIIRDSLKIATSLAGMVGVCLPAFFLSTEYRQSKMLQSCPTPWGSVGGCGAGSGAAVSGTGIKWIGATGNAMLSMQAGVEYSADADTALRGGEQFDGRFNVATIRVPLQLQVKKRGFTATGALPLIVKRGYGFTTGLLGDLTMGVEYVPAIPFDLGFGLSAVLPTGNGDIPKTGTKYMLPEMQVGSGVFSIVPALTGSLERSWGNVSFGTQYTAYLIGMTTTEWDYDTTFEAAIPTKQELKFTRDELGARNDIGTLHPDSWSGNLDLGIRSTGIIHGFSVGYSHPMRDAAYREHEQDIQYSLHADTSLPDPVREKSEAQILAEEMAEDGEKVYEDPVVVGLNYANYWVIVDRRTIERSAYPSLSFQYSIGTENPRLPVLVGLATRFYLDKGIHFSGITLGFALKLGLF